MKLIGMLDSPYVRRTVVSAHLMNLAIDHEALSVFRDFEQFRSINPLVKAPTLVFDDGTLMVDSQLIVHYLEPLAAPSKRLTPTDPDLRGRNDRLTSIALAACDKAVQLYYEVSLRPEPLRWPEWIERVSTQLRAAFVMLEDSIGDTRWLCDDNRLCHADVTAAIAWRFARHVVPDVIGGIDCPRLAALSEAAEALPAFQAADF
ncbi:MAG: glutathione S-transferase family protein [Rhodocyclaceae bacterium]|nr:glutathione S-transferase family protein [Propionibacteriaceae bacterium]MCB1962847.1 glutathione S-transferase family protein [Rhodocyclaceae bacterium]